MNHPICPQCECVQWCSKNGCIPLTPLAVAPAPTPAPAPPAPPPYVPGLQVLRRLP